MKLLPSSAAGGLILPLWPAVIVLFWASSLTVRPAAQPTQRIWHDVTNRSLSPGPTSLIDSSVYRTLRLDKAALEQVLKAAPMELSPEATEHPSIVWLPMPDGVMARFRCEESPVMELALARQHPEIRTYSGQGVDDATLTARFDWTPLGLHAIVLSGKAVTFIEPVSSSDTTTYLSYFSRDISMEKFSGSCLLSEVEMAEAEKRGVSWNQGAVLPAFVTGSTLRTYRLAVAATGEFTQQYGGGNVNTTLTKIVSFINDLSALYRKEATIAFQLIANETAIIFTDPATDGYTNSSPNAMLTENQAKLSAVIGSANYDIGHVFGGITVGPGSSSFSGVAIQGVCNSDNKGRGVLTMGGSVSSFPNAFFLSGLAHEVGHQFSARHTFNSTTGGCSGNRDGVGAYEPGSGSTIMAYGTCGADNLQPSNDMYFHTGSLEQIVSYANGAGNCATQTATGNGAPTIAALNNFTVPANTPFTLSASASDPNGDPLTFVWEEYDLGTAAPPHSDDGTRPIFRSFLPGVSSSRTFPSWQYILNNANVPPPTTSGYLTGEVIPATTRTMNFRFTARDNRANGGAANAPLQVSVVGSAGPFAVTAPNTPTSWSGNSVRSVTWNVANTATSTINCANVKILLSTDGGNTFPVTLAANTPNDGSELVLAPNTPTSAARVKVEAVGNIFFDVSDTNFSITGSTPTPSPSPSASPSPSVSPSPSPSPCGGSVFSERFDGVNAPTLPAGWTATNVGGDGTFWVTSTTTPDSAPNDAYIPDQNGVSDKRLDSPSISINSTSAQLSFRNNFITELTDGIYWDGGVLEVSSPNINGGAFTDILAAGGSFVSGGYTGVIDNTASNPLSGRMAWSGNSGGYINTVVNLGPNVSGRTIKLRFRMGTDLFVSEPGWRIDTISITDGPCTSPVQFGNIATRMRVDTGSSVMIGGFIISGNAPKNVVVRGVGPSLAAFGVSGALADPTLELRAANGSLIVQNDNWQDNPTQAAQLNALGFALPDSRESGIFATLQPASYTAILAGKSGGNGIGLVEIYDTNGAAVSQLANLSTRGFVLTGNNVMIGGFILAGNGSTRIVARGIGPSLAQFGISSVLTDPTLELRDVNGALLMANDDWQNDFAQAAELTALSLAPTSVRESGLLATLPPGSYTAILAGRNGGTGIGLIEIYNVH